MHQYVAILELLNVFFFGGGGEVSCWQVGDPDHVSCEVKKSFHINSMFSLC